MMPERTDSRVARASPRGGRAAASGLLDPARGRRALRHVAPGLGEAEQGQERQEDGGEEQSRRGARVPGPQAEPEVEADAGVGPGEQHHRGLAQAGHRVQHPHGQHDHPVGVVQAVPGMSEPGADHVVGEQRGHRQPDQELARLPGRHAERVPPVERPEREQHVGHERRIQRGRRHRGAPERDEPDAPGLHRGQGPQAERVVREMGDEVGDEHEPGGEPGPRHPGGRACHRLARRPRLSAFRAPPGPASAGAGGQPAPRSPPPHGPRRARGRRRTGR